MSSMDAFLLALPLIFAVGFGGAAVYEVWIERRLRADGITTEGQIAELRSDSRVGLRYSFIEYTYRSAGPSVGTYTSRQAVSRDHYTALQGRDRVTVSYLPQNPAVARLAGSDLDAENRQSMAIRALLVLIVWAILLAAAPR